jgi:hypothetical protein
MVCHSKDVLYNSVNAFYELGNNCKINNNLVISYFGIFARFYRIRPSALLQHTCIQVIKYTTYACVWFSFYINVYNILVLVGIAGYVVAPLYKYMWTYLDVDRIHT